MPATRVVKPLVLAALVIAVIALAITLVVPRERTMARPVTIDPPAAGTRASAGAGTDQHQPLTTQPSSPHPVHKPPATAPQDNAPPAWPLAERLARSEDLFALATSLRPAAVDGDPAAMWTLGRIYDSCELLTVKYGANDDPNLARRRLETVTAAMPANAAAYHQRQFERCRGFVASPDSLENPEIWQTLAAEAGHPAAQIKAWLDRRMDADIAPLTRARIMALIQSGHPDALAAAPRLLRLQMAAPADLTETTNELAWTLAACSLGLDCSPMSEATQIRCIWSNCAPDDPLQEVIRAETDPYIFEQASTYAERLRQHLSAGTLADASWLELQPMPGQDD